MVGEIFPRRRIVNNKFSPTSQKRYNKLISIESNTIGNKYIITLFGK